jgi:hypothetical protein
MAITDAKKMSTENSSVIMASPIKRKKTPDNASSKNFHTMSSSSCECRSSFDRPNARRNSPAEAHATAAEDSSRLDTTITSTTSVMESRMLMLGCLTLRMIKPKIHPNSTPMNRPPKMSLAISAQMSTSPWPVLQTPCPGSP